MKVAPPRWRVMLYCGIALFIASIFIFGEPFTNGRFLSTWLGYGSKANQTGWYEESVFAPNVEDVEPAIRRIGSRAIPVLLNKLDAADPAWKRRFDDWQSHAEWLPKVMQIQFHWAEEEQAKAMYGFSVLKTQAVSAIPALAQRLSATNTAAMAAYCLVKIGSASLPTLRLALTNGQASVRSAAIYGLESDESFVKETLPEIRLLRADSDERNAAAAFYFLYRHSPTNEAVDFLREALGRR